AFVSCSFFVSAAAATWNAYTYMGVTSVPAGKMMQNISKEISKKSNDTLTIRLHLGGSLPIKATNITQSVSSGVAIQLADDGFPYGNIPIAGILNLPMLLTSQEQFSKAIKILMPYFRKAYSKKGI